MLMIQINIVIFSQETAGFGGRREDRINKICIIKLYMHELSTHFPTRIIIYISTNFVSRFFIITSGNKRVNWREIHVYKHLTST